MHCACGAFACFALDKQPGRPARPLAGREGKRLGLSHPQAVPAPLRSRAQCASTLAVCERTMQALQRAQSGRARGQPCGSRSGRPVRAQAAAKQPSGDPRAARLARILRQYDGTGEPPLSPPLLPAPAAAGVDSHPLRAPVPTPLHLPALPSRPFPFFLQAASRRRWTSMCTSGTRGGGTPRSRARAARCAPARASAPPATCGPRRPPCTCRATPSPGAWGPAGGLPKAAEAL